MLAGTRRRSFAENLASADLRSLATPQRSPASLVAMLQPVVGRMRPERAPAIAMLRRTPQRRKTGHRLGFLELRLSMKSDDVQSQTNLPRWQPGCKPSASLPPRDQPDHLEQVPTRKALLRSICGDPCHVGDHAHYPRCQRASRSSRVSGRRPDGCGSESRSRPTSFHPPGSRRK